MLEISHRILGVGRFEIMIMIMIVIRVIVMEMAAVVIVVILNEVTVVNIRVRVRGGAARPGGRFKGFGDGGHCLFEEMDETRCYSI